MRGNPLFSFDNFNCWLSSFDHMLSFILHMKSLL